MSLTGDSLTVLLFFAGGMLACAVGALTAPRGWRARTLWAGVALFAGACLLLLGRFPRLEAASTLAIIAALTPPVTVAVVALLLPRRRPLDDAAVHTPDMPPAPLPPKRRPAEAKGKSHWEPDMSLHDAAIYVSTMSKWRVPYRSSDAVEALTLEIRGKLARGQITAWGRLHPEQDEYQIAPDAWEHPAETRLKDSYAFLPRYDVAVHKIRVARGEVEAAWPPKPAGRAPA